MSTVSESLVANSELVPVVLRPIEFRSHFKVFFTIFLPVMEHL